VVEYRYQEVRMPNPKEIQLDIRPKVPTSEMIAFKKACRGVGETMTSIVRRLVVKVANGDADLLKRIRS
jgi:hypothetical protein